MGPPAAGPHRAGAQYAEARTLAERALKPAQATFGLEHETVASILSILDVVLRLPSAFVLMNVELWLPLRFQPSGGFRRRCSLD